MLLTITTTHQPATDLGYLLHKNPERVQSFDLTFGRAHLFYPEARPERCTAALLVEVDPIGLIRNRRGPSGNGFVLEQYVNDRPYAASSLLSVALVEVFRTALSGRCKDRPELVEQRLPLTAHFPVLPCRGGSDILQRLFGPLGYTIEAEPLPLDEHFPDWGNSPYSRVTLSGTVRLCDLLRHLYVLVPVLDNDKHYWVGEDEVEKLLRHGQEWLAEHPARELIARRYLKHQRHLTRSALEQLLEEDQLDPESSSSQKQAEEETVEQTITGAAGTAENPPPLNEVRLQTVVDLLKESGAESVLDLGCGEGKLLRLVLREKQFTRIVGMDVSSRALEIAADRLNLERLPEKVRNRLQLMLGSLLYRDRRLEGFDAAAVVEVIEHLDPPRLASFERVVFEFCRPRSVVLTTPNAEYNILWPSLPAGRFRHRDHRFEWSREQFRSWAETIASRHGYRVRFLPVGPEHPEHGPPTQLALFELMARKP